MTYVIDLCLLVYIDNVLFVLSSIEVILPDEGQEDLVIILLVSRLILKSYHFASRSPLEITINSSCSNFKSDSTVSLLHLVDTYFVTSSFQNSLFLFTICYSPTNRVHKVTGPKHINIPKQYALPPSKYVRRIYVLEFRCTLAHISCKSRKCV